MKNETLKEKKCCSMECKRTLMTNNTYTIQSEALVICWKLFVGGGSKEGFTKIKRLTQAPYSSSLLFN